MSRLANPVKCLAVAAGMALALAGGPSGVAACAMCGARAKEGGGGYMIATAVLLVLPFASLGGFMLWLRRRKP